MYTPGGMSGRAHSARAKAWIRAGFVTVTWLGNAGSSSGTLYAWLRLTTRLVSAEVSRHRAGCAAPPTASWVPAVASWPDAGAEPGAGTLPQAATANAPATATAVSNANLAPL